MSLSDLIRRNASETPATAIPAIRATDDGQEGRTVAGIATVAVASPRSAETVQAEPVPTHTEPADDAPVLTDADPAAALHSARLHRFLSLGLRCERAQLAANRLALRDDDFGDDRRMCIECSHLGTRGYCIAAQRGRLIGAVRGLQPVPDLLQRCEEFGLRKGLAWACAGASMANPLPV